MEKLVELFEVTEWRGGAVYRTEYVRDEWVDVDARAPEGFVYANKSTSYEGRTLRMRRA